MAQSQAGVGTDSGNAKSRGVQFLLYAVPILIVVVMFVLMQVMPYDLGHASVEDGPVEDLTALGFAIAAIAFATAVVRDRTLRLPIIVWAPLMTLGWALLMLLACGEEISWGQRFLGVATPDSIAQINTQGEINLHNIAAVDEFMGGSYRWMSIYLLLTGLGIPLMALTKWGRRILGFFRFPVSPWCYSALFLGAYAYGVYYREWFPIPNLQPPNAPTEIREMLMAFASAFFAIHTALWPDEVYVDQADKNVS